MRKVFALVFFTIFLFLTPKVFASSDFSTNYNIKYVVSENKNTHVQMNVSLVNKTENYYASSYKIHVGLGDINSVKASDSSGNILEGVEKSDNDQIISVKFNDRITGLNNKLNYTIEFDTKDVAEKLGNLWEVNIPGLSSKSDVSNFNVSVIVPINFPKASYIKPNIKFAENKNIYNFSKEDLGESGISMTFGNEQIYKFNLTYHLYNKNLFPVETEIALPPSTNYQTVEIDDINYKPEDVIVDKDGNWLAQYTLSPSQKKDIIVNLKVKVNLTPILSESSHQNISDYLRDREFWNTSDKNIMQKAKELKTPYDVYNFVSNYLKYDYSRVTSESPRLGASKAFQNPSSAVCLEFTDLFIALARAAGIPAREIDGYAYTQNSKERPLSLVKDVLHAWPEYFDSQKNAWIMVDPTWANTTQGLDYFNVLDFDHIAFVIKGENSNYPVAAGGYKYPDSVSTKDVNVAFSQNFDEGKPTWEISDTFPKEIIAGFPLSGTITLRNAGKTLSSMQNFSVSSYDLKSERNVFSVNPIPPYGTSDLKVVFSPVSPLTNRKSEIRMAMGTSVISQGINIVPIFLNIWVIIGGLLIIGISIIFILIITVKSRSLPFFRKKV